MDVIFFSLFKIAATISLKVGTYSLGAANLRETMLVFSANSFIDKTKGGI